MLRRLFIALIVIALILAGSAAGLWRTYQHFLQQELLLPSEGLVYEVTPGTSIKALARDLVAKGILSNGELFRWYVRTESKGASIKAGEYLFEPGLTPVSLLAMLTSGKTLNYSLTLVEGLNFREFKARIAAHPHLTHSLQGLSDAEIMAKIGRAGQHPEGRFFPDTYLFPKGTSDLEILSQAATRMDQILADVWSQRPDNTWLKSQEDALILASLIEKETGAATERDLISGVFTRRLKKGMLLQTDPTVIYGMGDRFKGNIKREDLQEKTAYNTYVISGLPPTPICMPGKAALLAAIHPADGQSLYFVAKGDGSHQFSDNLDQHNMAVRKYQLHK